MQAEADRAARLGGVLFRWRGLVPLPVLAALLVVAEGPGKLFFVGLALVLLGEGLRLWGVAYIGPRSRTRAATVGALVRGGPYRRSRNPLYQGNLIALVGLSLWTGRPWAPLLCAPIFLHYALIVRWEESRLLITHGDDWRAFAARVPRWGLPVPASKKSASMPESEPALWRTALRSERSTLLALLLCGAALLAR